MFNSFFIYSNVHSIFDGNEFSDEDIEYIMNVTEAFKLLEPLVGTWEALKATKASLTPSERSMFYKELEKIAQDKEKVEEFTTSVLGYIDNENKKEYQL